MHRLFLAVILATAACGGGAKSDTTPAPTPAPAEAPPVAADPAPADPAPADPASGEVDPALEQEFLAMMKFIEDLGAAASGATGCDAKATAMKGVVDQNQALIARLNQLNTADEAKMEAIAAKHQARVEQAVGSIMGVAMECSEHPGVQEVMRSLEAGGGGGGDGAP